MKRPEKIRTVCGWYLWKMRYATTAIVASDSKKPNMKIPFSVVAVASHLKDCE